MAAVLRPCILRTKVFLLNSSVKTFRTDRILPNVALVEANTVRGDQEQKLTNRKDAESETPATSVNRDRNIDYFKSIISRFGNLDEGCFHHIWNSLKEGRSSLNTEESYTLLTFCGRAMALVPQDERKKLTEMVWKELPKLGIEWTPQHYCILMQVKMANGEDFSPQEILESLNKNDVTPTIDLFLLILQMYAEHGNLDGAKAIRALVEKYPTFKGSHVQTCENLMLLAHLKAKDFAGAKEISDNMKYVTSGTYTVYLRNCVDENDVEALKKVLHQMDASNIALNCKQTLVLLRKAWLLGHEDMYEPLLEILKSDPEWHGHNYKIVLRNAFHLACAEGPGQVIVEMSRILKSIATSNSFANFTIRLPMGALIRNQVGLGLTPREVHELVLGIEEINGVPLEERSSLSSIVRAYSEIKGAKPEFLLDCMREIHQLGQDINIRDLFDILDICRTQTDTEGIYQTLALFKEIFSSKDYYLKALSFKRVVLSMKLCSEDREQCLMRLKEIGFEADELDILLPKNPQEMRAREEEFNTHLRKNLKKGQLAEVEQLLKERTKERIGLDKAMSIVHLFLHNQQGKDAVLFLRDEKNVMNRPLEKDKAMSIVKSIIDAARKAYNVVQLRTFFNMLQSFLRPFIPIPHAAMESYIQEFIERGAKEELQEELKSEKLPFMPNVMMHFIKEKDTKAIGDYATKITESSGDYERLAERIAPEQSYIQALLHALKEGSSTQKEFLANMVLSVCLQVNMKKAATLLDILLKELGHDKFKRILPSVLDVMIQKDFLATYNYVTSRNIMKTHELLSSGLDFCPSKLRLLQMYETSSENEELSRYLRKGCFLEAVNSHRWERAFSYNSSSSEWRDYQTVDAVKSIRSMFKVDLLMKKTIPSAEVASLVANWKKKKVPSQRIHENLNILIRIKLGKLLTKPEMAKTVIDKMLTSMKVEGRTLEQGLLSCSIHDDLDMMKHFYGLLSQRYPQHQFYLDVMLETAAALVRCNAQRNAADFLASCKDRIFQTEYDMGLLYGSAKSLLMAFHSVEHLDGDACHDTFKYLGQIIGVNSDHYIGRSFLDILIFHYWHGFLLRNDWEGFEKALKLTREQVFITRHSQLDYQKMISVFKEKDCQKVDRECRNLLKQGKNKGIFRRKKIQRNRRNGEVQGNSDSNDQGISS